MARSENYIDQVVVDDHRIRYGREVRVGLKEPIVDDHITVQLGDT